MVEADAAEAEPPVSYVSICGLGHLALVALTCAPLLVRVEPNVNIVTTATLAVYVGCCRSLKKVRQVEAMTQGDAMKFPLVGSCVLFGLFLLFRFLPKELVNTVLTAYFLLIGVAAITATLTPFVEPLCPKSLRHRQFHLGTVRVPVLLPDATPLSTSVPQAVAGLGAAALCTWYCLAKHWIANNLLGLSFAVQALEFLSVGSVQIGAILLCGLFVYDVFWVFCTPVMVAVAKSFDAPIKLLFPRMLASLLTGEERPFSMLGLGDIVVPGVFVALLLRYDHERGAKGYPLFRAALVGYALGLMTTIVVMNWFDAAQPALLYIVPGVLLSTMGVAAARGEVKQLLLYDENGDADAADATEAKKTE